jgi:dephospho-CoA kinase
MSRPLIIGLTGGIGSGKTAASDWFALQGISIVDTDVIARTVVEPHQPAWHDIVQYFGSDILNTDQTLNRAALRQQVFRDVSARQQLEAFTHPRIRELMLTQLHAAQSPYVMLVSPLLLESSQHEWVDRVLLIDVPEAVQQQRAAQRDGQSAADIARIMAAQLPRHERQQRAHDIVNNQHDLDTLYAQLQPLHEQYLTLAKRQQALRGAP